jgi:hypothetical protein
LLDYVSAAFDSVIVPNVMDANIVNRSIRIHVYRRAALNNAKIEFQKLGPDIYLNQIVDVAIAVLSGMIPPYSF